MVPFLFMIGILLPTLLSAQSLYPVSRHGKWGFIDSTGTVIIPLQYDGARLFVGEYAPVLVKKGWGMVDKAGRWIISPQFATLNYRDSGMLEVRLGREEYYYALDGRRLTEEEFAIWWEKAVGRLLSLNPNHDGRYFVSLYPASLWDHRRRIKVEGKYGYVDSVGSTVIPPQYDYARPFYRGLAPVNIGAQVESVWSWEQGKGGRWGVVDGAGTIVVPLLYDEVSISPNGQIISAKRQGGTSLYLRNGDLLIESNDAELVTVNDSMIVATHRLDGIQSALLSFSGDTLIPFDYERIDQWDADRFFVKDFDENWGVISLREGQLLPNIFTSLRAIDSNILIAGIRDNGDRDQFSRRRSAGFIKTDVWYRLINDKGHEILPGRWREIHRLNDDLSLFVVADEINGKGVIHLDGRSIVPQDWYGSIRWCDGLIELARDSCSFRFINPDGSAAIERCFIDLEEYAPEATFITVSTEELTGDRKGLIDSIGTIKTVFGDDKFGIRNLDERFNEGLMRVQYRGNNVEFINPDGQTVLGPYERAKRFSEGLAAVAVPDGDNPEKYRYGFVDRQGTMVIPPRFDSAEFFREGLASVGVLIEGDMKWGFIDRKGKWIIKPRFGYARPFSDGLAAVLEWTDSGMVIYAWGCMIADERYERIGSWGAIDKKGRIVIPATLDYLYDFHNGAASADADSGGSGIIDRKGNWLVPPTFPWIGEFTGELAPASFDLPSFGEVTGDGIGYIDRTGDWVIAPRFQSAGSFTNGRAAVRDEEACRKVWYVNTEGKVVWPR